MCRTATPIHDKKTIRFKTGALHEMVDPIFQFSVFKRLKFWSSVDPHHVPPPVEYG
jgi:hypothetical protein